jgi:hypothetical protein
VGHRAAAPDAPGEVRDRRPGSGSTDAPVIPAAAPLLAAQTMTATPPAIAAARTVRTRIQAGGTSLVSTAQPLESRAAPLPLLTVQSSAEDSPAFLSVLMPHCLDSCALRNRSSGRDLSMDAHRRAAVGIRRRETSCRSPLTVSADARAPIFRKLDRGIKSPRGGAQLICGRCPLAAALRASTTSRARTRQRRRVRSGR